MNWLAGKVVGEDTPDVEYSTNTVGLGSTVEEVNPFPGAKTTPGPTEGGPRMVTARRKAPLWKLLEDVEMEVPDPLLTAVTVGGATTPETS